MWLFCITPLMFHFIHLLPTTQEVARFLISLSLHGPWVPSLTWQFPSQTLSSHRGPITRFLRTGSPVQGTLIAWSPEVKSGWRILLKFLLGASEFEFILTSVTSEQISSSSPTTPSDQQNTIIQNKPVLYWLLKTDNWYSPIKCILLSQAFALAYPVVGIIVSL